MPLAYDIAEHTLPNGLRECPRATLAGGAARTVLMGAPVAFLSLHRLGKVDLLFSEVREVAVLVSVLVGGR